MSLSVSAAETNRAPILQQKLAEDVYAAGQFGASAFASYRLRDFDGLVDRFGAGGELSYSFTRTWTIALEGQSENTQHSFFDTAGVLLKPYLPIKDSGAALYGILGWVHEFDAPGDGSSGSSNFTAASGSDATDEARDRMAAGVGFELRGKKGGFLGGTLKVFVDGRWEHNFKEVGIGLFRAGGGLNF